MKKIILISALILATTGTAAIAKEKTGSARKPSSSSDLGCDWILWKNRDGTFQTKLSEKDTPLFIATSEQAATALDELSGGDSARSNGKAFCLKGSSTKIEGKTVYFVFGASAT